MKVPMHPQFSQLMKDATALTRAGNLQAAMAAITEALEHGPSAVRPSAPVEGTVIDVEARVIDDGAPVIAPEVSADSQFVSGHFTHRAGGRDYRLFIPRAQADKPRALVLMLHGCTQNPDDFAKGTRMNALGAEYNALVLYPAQTRQANAQGCWNWFKHNHQVRGRGEPAFIADLARTVVAEHGLDPCRVFIAGLSAGGAMAAITAQAYPELFAAVGVHSGLPIGAASDMGEAMAAMRDGAAPGSGLLNGPPVPTIVFHGDDDSTVHPRNGEQVLSAALGTSTPASVENGRAAKGRHFTRSTHHAKQGHAVAEHWLVHGAGHAWSGGQGSGSFTDPQGPDASAEMLRFFLAQPRRPARAPRFPSSPHDKAPP